ncbi:MAG: cytochrome c3 family protein, partial [Rhodocyclaceae bacterium]|nr:cytochrome c3 family protein [Rhodocyclaceae bacterium]
YSSTTLTNATVTQPGANSLACLSCHDGQTAVDSIINMPGSGRYLESQKTSQSNAFLNTWNNTRGPDATVHLGLAGAECLACHSSTAGFIGAGATDFTVFAIGTNLTNDHPIGVLLPTGEDWKVPGGTKGTTKFFDANGDGRMSSNEVRLYAGDRGPEVECASCHDPHGVPSGGPGSPFNKSFLRVSDAGSAICLTCHSK